MPPEFALSVSIVCFETPEAELDSLFRSLSLSLQTLKQHYPATQLRLSLIDNSESHPIEFAKCEALSLLITSQQAELQIYQGHGNIGYGRGHNLAIVHSSIGYHLILNTDIQLEAESLVQGIESLQEHPDWVLVSPLVHDKQGQRQFLCKRYPAALTLLIRGFCPTLIKNLFKPRMERYEYRDKADCQEPWQAEIASGCFMLCRSSALQSIAGFDPAYFLYFEDFDLSLRIAKQGRVMFMPTMRVEHYGGNAAGKGLRHIVLFIRSAWTFYSAHGWRLFRQ